MKKRYGLIFVDQDEYGNGTHGRYPKDSYAWYKGIAESNGKALHDSC
jgi:6-phospho-beta-glucosidase